MNRGRNTYVRLMCGAAMLAMTAFAGGANAAEETFDIAPQPLAMALKEFGVKTGQPVLYGPALADHKTSAPVVRAADPERALLALLEGTGLTYRRNGDTFLIVQAGEGGDAPQSGSAAGGGAEVEALIVTAQKKEEDIQDVPIAISAFTAKDLEQQKIEGGFDLLKAIPNVTFSKTNFSSYNFSIRGIGTKAISATTDPGVAVAHNSSGVIQNRLFEQEYVDIERVEVLRGPQGTLYGRNATSGVINVITAKPRLNEFDGWIKGEVGNYDTKRVSAMVNVPLVRDVLGIRLAGALTSRDGYDFNTITKQPVNGRDLWSTRVTIGFEPNERLRADLIWERFEEDDNRSRTGKQLCHRDPDKFTIGSTNVAQPANIGWTNSPSSQVLRPAIFSQGCRPGSLYDDDAFGTPNGLSLPFIFGPLALQLDGTIAHIGRNQSGALQSFVELQDPYGGAMQSRNLREIASIRDPIYRARADLLELNIDFALTDDLTIVSQTLYNEDQVYSFQDFNRFNTKPIFFDTSQLQPNSGVLGDDYRQLAPGGVFCDPQIGCSDRMAGFDISQASGKQFGEELRLQSSFDGPLNFNLGANYTEFETVADYYVMFNILTALALSPPFNRSINGEIDIATCYRGGFFGNGHGNPVPAGDPLAQCPYIDPNPVESINGEGHNYFLSKNPYELKSWAGFGELYWEINDTLKLTAGLRYTKDEKTFTPIPSQLLLAPSLFAGGVVSKGYPGDEPIVQKWGEWTGRLVLDWSPELSFTEETMLYGSYSRGYKGGGANPPSPGFPTFEEARDVCIANANGFSTFLCSSTTFLPVVAMTAIEYGPTFEPEFVDAYEIGAKNTLLDGAMTFNATAFYYDYTDYQVSQIRDRTAVNENFDAKVWGLEFETLFAPSPNLRINANLGYLNTEIADGEESIDIMNRTQGNPNYVLMKPWVQLPSNCVVPLHIAEKWLQTSVNLASYFKYCGKVGGLLGGSQPVVDVNTGANYSAAYYNGANGTDDIHGGAGLAADLGGNELPNAPHWTANIGAQYGIDMLDGWRATVRGDLYWQSQSWHRVYNADPYDKLHGWYNANLSLWIERPDDDLKIELYAKNILNDTPITDAFLNSDDTGLTTNVFTLDPRLIGLSIRKEF